MKKILFASHSAALTGAPQVLFNVVSRTDRLRFEPFVLFPEDGPIADRFRSLGISPEIINLGGSGFSDGHIPMLKAFCLSRGIELIHANTVRSYPLALVAKELGIPCFWHIHEMFLDKSAYSVDEVDLREAIKSRPTVGMPSEACKKEFSDYCHEIGVEVPEMVVVRNGVEAPDRFRPFSRSPAGDIEILAVSSYCNRKGLHYLLDAFKSIVDEHKAARLTLVGAGQPDSFMQLYERAEGLGISDHVRFLTAVTDVNPLLYAADIAVNSSLMENLSLSVAEAMAHAKPVVATDVGGTRELLRDGETGLLVPPRDPEALAGAIRAFIERPDFARQCGEKAREHIKKNFGIRGQVERLQDIYDSLLRGVVTPSGATVDGADRIYDLIYDSLVSVNEEFRRIEERMEQTDRHVAGYLNSLERDVRTVERVIENLLQKPPIRLYRAIMGLAKHVRRVFSRLPESEREE
jgi:glycosyltransferase involved in cell wall biosynthesis